MGIEWNPVPVAFGRFSLLGRLGNGGMGDVHVAAADCGGGVLKLLAVKTLRESFAKEEDALEMLMSEARLSARFEHPNIVQTLEVGEVSGRHYVCMELLRGQPLVSILRERPRRVPVGVLLRILHDGLRGLHAAHEARDDHGRPLMVVHRDFTPQNIFVSYDGRVCVLDFGVAKAAGASVETRAGVVKGKISYMPGEQIRGMADRRVDVYAAGAILWEILTGQRLHAGRSDAEIVAAILSEEPVPRPSRFVAGVDEELEAICLRALALDANHRFASAAEMADSLEDHLDRTGAPPRLDRVMREAYGAENAELEHGLRRTLSSLLSGSTPRSQPPRDARYEDSGGARAGASRSGSGHPGHSLAPLSASTTSTGPASPRTGRRAWSAGVAGVVALGVVAFFGLRAARSFDDGRAQGAASRLPSVPCALSVAVEGGDAPASVQIGGIRVDGPPYRTFVTDVDMPYTVVVSDGRRAVISSIRCVDGAGDLTVVLPRLVEAVPTVDPVPDTTRSARRMPSPDTGRRGAGGLRDVPAKPVTTLEDPWD